MNKFISSQLFAATLFGQSYMPLFDRLTIDPHSDLFVRSDGMVQSGPDPVEESNKVVRCVPKRVVDLAPSTRLKREIRAGRKT